MTTTNLPSIVALANKTPRRQPYFMPVAGQDDLKLGFRKMPDSGAESWLAQWPDAAAASGRKEVSLRGKATCYDSAVKAAIKARAAAKASLVDTGMTIKQLCAAYADLVEQGGVRLQLKVKVTGPRPDTADKMRGQQRRYISGSACDAGDERGYAVDPIAHVKLRNLTEAMCAAWRERVVAQAIEKNGKPMSDATLNKELQVLRAPLNWGADIKKDEHLQSRVWKGALEKLDTDAANAKRELYLSHDDRKAIAEKAGPALKLLMKFLLLTSVRPGAAAALKVSSFKFNPTGDSVLTFGKDKTKASSYRVVFIPLATAKFIKEVIGDRIGNLPLLTREDGKAWTSREWGRAFKKARNAAFPRGHANRKACVYTLRHCAITDLVEAGQHALEVAHWSGTSIKMIQEVYFQNRARNENNGLARLVVNF